MSSDNARQLRLEKSVLESNYSFLVEALVPEDIVPELFSKKLITKYQKEKADSHAQRYAKNVAIMDSLLGRAEVGAFHRFCDVLSSTSGQEYIADRLTACFQSLMQGETQHTSFVAKPSNSHPSMFAYSHAELIRHPSTSNGGSMEYIQAPDLKDLMDALYHMVADKWEPIGIYLHLSMATLRAIAAERQHDPHKCLIGMLEVWLKRVDPPPTWSAIIEAVEFLGEKRLARELKEKYILPTD